MDHSETDQLTTRQLLELERICDDFESEQQLNPAMSATDLDRHVSRASTAVQPILRAELEKLLRENNAQAREDLYPFKNVIIETHQSGETTTSVPTEATRRTRRSRSSQTAGERFQLIEKLGEGGSGVVWRAFDSLLNRNVALKVARIESQSTAERFLREARAAARLHHPNIIRVLEVGQDAVGSFLLNELIEGESLAEKLLAGRLDQCKAIGLLLQICEALSYAHGMGIVHRDLKPHNILVDEDWVIKLVDFGLAKDHEDCDATLTQKGSILGTPAYMSPEQVTGEGPSRAPTCDIFALGVVFYQLLTGEIPFRGTRDGVLYQILHIDPLAPSRLDDAIPAELERLCLKCLEKKPEDRFQTASELRDELLRYQGDEPILLRPPGAWTRLKKWTSRNPRSASWIAAGFLFLVSLTLVASIASILIATSWHREHEQLLIAIAAEETAESALTGERSALQEARLANDLAQHQLQVAMRESQLSHETVQFLESILASSDPVAAAFSINEDSTEPPTLKTVFDATVRRLRSELADQPLTRARLLDAIANGYRATGNYKIAATLLDEAKTIRLNVNQDVPDEDIALHAFYRGRTAHDQSEFDLAEVCYQQALDLLEGDRREHCEIEKANVLFHLGKLLIDTMRWDEAATSMSESYAIRCRHLPADSPQIVAAAIGKLLSKQQNLEALPLNEILKLLDNQNWAEQIASRYTKGLAFRRQENYEAAVEQYQLVLTSLQELLPENHPLLLLALGDYIGLLYESGNYRDAYPIVKRVFEIADQVCPGNQKLISAKKTVAFELVRASRFSEAARLYEEILQKAANQPIDLRTTREGLAWCSLADDKPAVAREQLAILWNDRELLTTHGTAWLAHAYARALDACGQTKEAQEMDRIALQEAKDVKELPIHGIWLERLAVVHSHSGDFETAEEILRVAVHVERDSRPANHPRTADRLASLAHVLTRRQKNEEAAALLKEALEIREQKLPEEDRRIAENKQALRELAGD